MAKLQEDTVLLHPPPLPLSPPPLIFLLFFLLLPYTTTTILVRVQFCTRSNEESVKLIITISLCSIEKSNI